MAANAEIPAVTKGVINENERVTGMKKIVALIALASTGSAAAQKVPVMPKEYTLFCQGEKATGFEWRDGDWLETTFEPKDFLVERRDTNVCLKGAEYSEKLVHSHFLEIYTRDVCLNIREAGTEYQPFEPRPCKEFYDLDKEENWNIAFYCDHVVHQMTGSPTGWYQMVSAGDVLGTDGTKESMKIEIGKCSIKK